MMCCLVSTYQKELNVPATQLLALFNKAMRKVATTLRGVEERAVRDELPLSSGHELDRPELKQSLAADLADGGKAATKGMKERQKVLKMMNLEKFAIGGTDDEWSEATGGATPSTIRYSHAP
jgi:N-acetyltransferase 10